MLLSKADYCVLLHISKKFLSVLELFKMNTISRATVIKRASLLLHTFCSVSTLTLLIAGVIIFLNWDLERVPYFGYFTSTS